MLAGLPVLIVAWALASPATLLSKVMTQDLLFNLSGAWHVYSGHVAPVDFHDASGRLSFLLTALGFHLLGPVPFAFLVNVAIMGQHCSRQPSWPRCGACLCCRSR
ncbi:MAG: hypothetical protein GEV13_33595 [Rhodospirillales bacterium]|nr:hypothetical protein [Rhodospirillales bacterium]